MLLCPSDARKLFLKSSGGHQKAAVPAFSCQAEPPKTACYDSPVFSSLSPSPPFKHGYLRVLTRNVCFCEPTLPLLFAWFTRRLTIPAQAHRQKFLEGWGTGRENLFPKRFPSPQAFPPKQKIPGWYRGRSQVGHLSAPQRKDHKKRPPRAESCKGVSNNLWQRPTFPHDVMQYHRRWRA